MLSLGARLAPAAGPHRRRRRDAALRGGHWRGRAAPGAGAGAAFRLAAFSAVQLAVHFCVLGAAKAFFGLPIRELAVASNAAVGGPRPRPRWHREGAQDDLVLPALLVGILGYATGTFVSIGLLAAWVSGLACLYSLLPPTPKAAAPR